MASVDQVSPKVFQTKTFHLECVTVFFSFSSKLDFPTVFRGMVSWEMLV